MKMAKAIVMASMMLALASRINAQDIFDAIHNGDLAKVKEFVEKNRKRTLMSRRARLTAKQPITLLRNDLLHARRE